MRPRKCARPPTTKETTCTHVVRTTWYLCYVGPMCTHAPLLLGNYVMSDRGPSGTYTIMPSISFVTFTWQASRELQQRWITNRERILIIKVTWRPNDTPRMKVCYAHDEVAYRSTNGTRRVLVMHHLASSRPTRTLTFRSHPP